MGWSRRLVLTPETLQLYRRHLPGCLIVRLHVLPPKRATERAHDVSISLTPNSRTCTSRIVVIRRPRITIWTSPP
jgi:hypothetical protein